MGLEGRGRCNQLDAIKITAGGEASAVYIFMKNNNLELREHPYGNRKKYTLGPVEFQLKRIAETRYV